MFNTKSYINTPASRRGFLWPKLFLVKYFLLFLKLYIMAHNPALLQLRNKNIKERFRQLRKRNPKWTWIAIIEETAKEFYLSPATITKIVNQDDNAVPCVNTVIKHTRAALSA